MSRLIDLDQTIFVPIVDESHGGATYEMQMTIAEFFDKFLDGFKPEVADAVPVEWLKAKAEENSHYAEPYFAFAYVLHEWWNAKSIEEQQAESEMRDWKAEQEDRCETD